MGNSDLRAPLLDGFELLFLSNSKPNKRDKLLSLNVKKNSLEL